MKKTTTMGLLALLVVGLIISTTMVNAYRGDYTVKGPNYSEERYNAMLDAMETSNYDAWYSLMTENERMPRIVDFINEDNFDLFVKLHDAKINGDIETINDLRAELGLNEGLGPKSGSGFGKAHGQRMQQNNFVDLNNDGVCDNAKYGYGRQRQ